MWRPLGELLLEKGLVSPDELELALTEQAESGRLLGAILVERGYVSGPALAVALAEQYGVELPTEQGFGTGLWAEIDRRHRAGRGQNEELEQDEEPGRDEEPRPQGNVVKLEPVAAPRVEVVPDPEPDPDPELERLEAENYRLLDELARLRGEFARLTVAEAPKQASAHLLFVPTAERYLLARARRRAARPRRGAPGVRGRRQVQRHEGRPRALPGRATALRLPAAPGLTGKPRRLRRRLDHDHVLRRAEVLEALVAGEVVHGPELGRADLPGQRRLRLRQRPA